MPQELDNATGDGQQQEKAAPSLEVPAGLTRTGAGQPMSQPENLGCGVRAEQGGFTLLAETIGITERYIIGMNPWSFAVGRSYTERGKASGLQQSSFRRGREGEREKERKEGEDQRYKGHY